MTGYLFENLDPGAPRLSSGLADTELVVGQTVVLKCVIEGNPTPRVNWFKDNLMIMVTPRHKIQHVRDFKLYKV